jgi:1,4-alpha-glucan branching enzyme
MLYQYAENFVTVFSHDEVVHGKGSMLFKMAAWHIPEKAANLRALYAHMWVAGQEAALHGRRIRAVPRVGPRRQSGLAPLPVSDHEGVRLLVRDLNRLYTSEPVLGANDFNPQGFRWLSPVTMRTPISSPTCAATRGADVLFAVVCHFGGAPREYRIGVPRRRVSGAR